MAADTITAVDEPTLKKMRVPSGLAGEKGVSGLVTAAGKIEAEYNTALATLNSRMTRFEEMRRSDTAIAVMESLISLPIRETTWDILPGSDAGIAREIADNLGLGAESGPGTMTHSWDEMLRQILLAPLYGFTAQEKVFEMKPSGFLGWRKFPSRARTTIDRWEFDDKGGLRGLVQKGYKPGTYEIIEANIPIEKMVIWTWRPDDGDPEGFGMMRQAYKAWMYKAAFEEFAAIRIERQACGIPVAIGPEEGYTETESNKVLALLQRLRTAESSGLVMPFGWTVEMLELGDASVPFEDHLEREHQYILQSGLMGFVGLGQGGDTGAWALSRDLSSLFLMILNAVADWVAETMNRYVIPQIVAFNRRDVLVLPQLTHGSVAITDPRIMAEAVAQIFDPGLSLRTIAPEVEVELRERFGLPPAPDPLAADERVVEDAETDTTETDDAQEVVDDGDSPDDE